MELLSPAGSIEKLRYAYRYGADAAYIGLPLFSLRAKAENIDDTDEGAPEKIARVKSFFSLERQRKLYCAVNIVFHDDDLRKLESALPRIAEYPFDGFIVSDTGAYDILREAFPDKEFHLSTQADCTNWRAARHYLRMGFSRIVPGRELSLDEIKTIKDHVPELEIEAFVHGAMCMAYSGRCFISSWLTGRSANQGDCAHSCRWHYKVYIEEEERKGRLIPVETGETAHGGYTLIMSSRDLNMVDHLDDLRRAGVDSIKIEGRMKSLYYVALTTRAYRFALDHPSIDNPFKQDLEAVSHREFDTGFYYSRNGMDTSTSLSYQQSHLFIGSVEPFTSSFLINSLGEEILVAELFARFSSHEWTAPVFMDLKNTVSLAAPLELLGPEGEFFSLAPSDYRFFDIDGNIPEKANHGKIWFFQARRAACPADIQLQWLLRKQASRQ